MKRKFLEVILCIGMLVQVVGCSNRIESTVNDSQSQVEKNTDVEDSTEIQKEDFETEQTEPIEENEIPQVYTIDEMSDKIEQYFKEVDTSEKYEYTRDEYDDNISITNPGGGMTVLQNEGDNYGMIIYPVIKTYESSGKTCLVYTIQINYVSGDFLDYIFDTNCTILASDGTKYKFLLKEINQLSDEENRYETDLIFFMNFSNDGNKTGIDETNLNHMEKLLEKNDLTLRINYANNNGTYPLEQLDEETINNIKQMNELYKSLSIYLNYTIE